MMSRFNEKKIMKIKRRFHYFLLAYLMPLNHDVNQTENGEVIDRCFYSLLVQRVGEVSLFVILQ